MTLMANGGENEHTLFRIKILCSDKGAIGDIYFLNKRTWRNLLHILSKATEMYSNQVLRFCPREDTPGEAFNSPQGAEG